MSRYDRQMILPEIGEAGQKKLGASHVLIVGAGGLAATVIPALTGAGVGRIRLIDGDLVSEGNLHRQTFFQTNDIGQPKVDCAARAALLLNPDVTIEPLRQWLDPKTVGSALNSVDLVIDAADSFAVSYILSDHCRSRGLPLISASVLGRQGYVGGFCADRPCLRAVFPDLPEQAQSCATAGVMGPAVAVMGALQAQMALAVLLGLVPSPIGRVVSVDLSEWRFSGFRFDNAPNYDGPTLPFISYSELRDADCVIELRSAEETIQPVTTSAIRLDVNAVKDWTAPRGQRIVLCCQSGLRAWRAANTLAGQGYRDLALLAVGDKTA